MKRVAAGLVAIAFLALAAGWAPRHGTPVRTCKATGQVRFSPPLSGTPGTTEQIYRNSHTNLSSCVLDIATGTFAGTLTGTGSCAHAKAKGTLTFTWSLGPKSKASVKFKSLSNGKGKLTGTVTHGQLKGSAVSGTLTFTVIKGNCTKGPGVSLATFTGKLTI